MMEVFARDGQEVRITLPDETRLSAVVRVDDSGGVFLEFKAPDDTLIQVEGQGDSPQAQQFGVRSLLEINEGLFRAQADFEIQKILTDIASRPGGANGKTAKRSLSLNFKFENTTVIDAATNGIKVGSVLVTPVIGSSLPKAQGSPVALKIMKKHGNVLGVWNPDSEQDASVITPPLPGMGRRDRPHQAGDVDA